MGVIRASRLWAWVVSPNALAGTLPAGTIEEDPRAPLSIYTCPGGYKAIVRTMTHTLKAIPPAGSQPTFSVYLRPAGVGLDIQVHYFWWVEHFGTTEDRWHLHNLWNGQLVLNAGDAILIHNVSSVSIDSHASGHLLPLQ